MHKAKPRKGGDTGKSAEGERSEGLDYRAEAASLKTKDHSYQEWPRHKCVKDRHPYGPKLGQPRFGELSSPKWPWPLGAG